MKGFLQKIRAMARCGQPPPHRKTEEHPGIVLGGFDQDRRKGVMQFVMGGNKTFEVKIMQGTGGYHQRLTSW